MSRVYRITEGSLTERFHASVSKVQVFAGGFANGKTSALCIKALNVAKDYPGASILLGRSTFPKLNDTLRREFFKWMPPKWRKSFDKKENTLELVNGSTIFFRYLMQQGKNEEQTTSNLLSANYDFIGIDQIDDPQIVHKDFLDLLGRLRGSTEYSGDNKRWPVTGPRWFVCTANPTRNWVYRELIRPLHMYAETGIVSQQLMFDEVSGKPMIELFEGSTYENQDNLAPDYIRSLELAYKGQMRDRYMLGKWGAFEGLVYPQFDQQVHVITHDVVVQYMLKQLRKHVRLKVIEGYDHGLIAPTCYMLAFVDEHGCIFLLDGFYEKEQSPEASARRIKEIRNTYSLLGLDTDSSDVFADPDVFRRKAGNARTVGVTVADMYRDEGVYMVRGNSDIKNGLVKVQSYLNLQRMKQHPISGNFNSPSLYVSSKLDFFSNEITDYYWKRNTSGEYEDEPQGRNDHAMDTIKYMLSDLPQASPVVVPREFMIPAHLTKWSDREVEGQSKDHRRYVR